MLIQLRNKGNMCQILFYNIVFPSLPLPQSGLICINQMPLNSRFSISEAKGNFQPLSSILKPSLLFYA